MTMPPQNASAGPHASARDQPSGSGADVVDAFRVLAEPNYVPHNDEIDVFRHAFTAQVPVVLKGPTGCGKTRFLEYMAWMLELPLITISCHEDLTAADLVGRFLLTDQSTRWQDGPLTLAARHGAICYLDEIVEARNDTTVIIHSLTDHRRTLFIDKTGELIHAHPKFLMVLSYNPGYQNIAKDLKQSTRQRFISLQFNHPQSETESRILRCECDIDRDLADRLAELGSQLRRLKGFGLEEGASTRLLVYAGLLIRQGLTPATACRVAIGQTLCDESQVMDSIDDLINLHFA
jgi:nitric oxide reductase NorQ protein